MDLKLNDIIKLRTLRQIAFCAMIACAARAYSLPADFFAAESKLAEGKWVKVFTPESGVYSITYAELLEMGFSDPTKVGVFGSGGTMLNPNFIDGAGSRSYIDDLQPVSAVHHDERLVFYGRGTDNIEWDSTAGNRRFVNKDKNIYTDAGCYFLTDRYGNSEVKEEDGGGDNPDDLVAELTSYFYHEKDLMHNYLDSGRLFLGEKIASTPVAFPYSLPGADLDNPVKMELSIYGHVSVPKFVNYDFNGTKMGSVRIPTFTSDRYAQAATGNLFSGKIEKAQGEIGMSVPLGSDDLANLNYVLITYSRSPELSDGEVQYKGVADAAGGMLKAENPAVRVWDITDPYQPVSIGGKEGSFILPKKDSDRLLTVFDINSALYSVAGYEAVENSNLHSLGTNEVPEMLIIALPEFLEGAEKIADVHRRIEGMNVAVVTDRQVYNEFSGGKPDPMAYRAICKMLYDRDNERFANVFFIGPMLADVRQLDTPQESRIDALVAYQSKESCESLSSYNITDAAGMLEDYSSLGYQARPMLIGVGVLPVKDPSQVDMYAGKVERYLTDDSFADWNTSMHFSADFGNSHLHLNTDEELASDIDANWNRKMIFQKDYLDCKPDGEPTQCFLRDAHNGVLLSTYFGHGSKTYIGSGDTGFLRNVHTHTMDNKRLMFMTFAGCMVSRFDNGEYGVGDAITISNPYGAIGSLATLRVTWANQNTSLIKLFQSALYDADISGKAPTIGKAVARAKSECQFANKFNFQLVCDPSIRIPVPVLNVKSVLPESLSPGGKMTVNGRIELSDGSRDEAFNGSAVIKILTPSVVIPSANTQDRWNSEHIDVEYPGDVIATYNVEVSNGEFSIPEVFVPASLGAYAGLQGVVHISAYDPDRRISAAMTQEAKIAKEGSGENPDSALPAISLLDASETPDGVLLRLNAHSEAGLRINPVNYDNPLKIEIDGTPYGRSLQPFVSLSNGAQDLELLLPLDLESGKHFISVTVTDYAGQTAESSIEVVTSRCIAGEAPEPDAKVAERPVTFALTADRRFDTNRELVVYSHKNEIVKVIAVKGDTVEWNLTDLTGAPVADGLYKAVFRGISPLGEAVQTPPCRIPVVR